VPFYRHTKCTYKNSNQYDMWVIVKSMNMGAGAGNFYETNTESFFFKMRV
jgi:hypothetical protein